MENQKIKENEQKDSREDLVMDLKQEFKGQEYDGIRDMVKAIKKSLGPKRAR